MMKGSSFEVDCESSSPKTIVLVGRKGTGKSATGNSILGTNIFRSERCSSGVTIVCEMRSTKLEDGLVINVIDTPGIFGTSVESEVTDKEIITMAGDGIHAFLVVFSIRSRFSKEEEAALNRLLSSFGSKVYDYMILVFTGGDQLDKDDETLEDFLHDCPAKLKELIYMCANRCVLFDNKTEDQTKRSDQVEKLFSIVSMMSRKNGGKAYNIEMFTEWKKEAKELKEQAESYQTEMEITMLADSMHEGKFKQITEMIEPKLKESTMRLELQVQAERAARLTAEEDAKAFQKKSEELIRKRQGRLIRAAIGEICGIM